MGALPSAVLHSTALQIVMAVTRELDRWHIEEGNNQNFRENTKR